MALNSDGAPVRGRAFLMVAPALPGLFAATTQANGTAMGAITALSILVAWVVSGVVPRFAGRLAAVPVALMLNAAVMVLAGFALRAAQPVIYQDLGMYVLLTGLSGAASVYVARACLPGTGEGRALTARDMLWSAGGAFASLLLVGFLNEMLGAGTIFGMTVPGLAESPIAIFGKPAGSLLLLALVAAFAQALDGSRTDKGGER